MLVQIRRLDKVLNNVAARALHDASHASAFHSTKGLLSHCGSTVVEMLRLKNTLHFRPSMYRVSSFIAAQETILRELLDLGAGGVQRTAGLSQRNAASSTSI